MTKKLTLLIMFVFMQTIISAFAEGDVWYISADPNEVNQHGYNGNGTRATPWNLRRGFEQLQKRPNFGGGWQTLKEAGANRAKPGDIIYLLGGTYRLSEMGSHSGHSNVAINDNSNCPGLKGTIDKPILVMPYPGHHVIIDLAFTQEQINNIPNNFWQSLTHNSMGIRGEYTYYYDFEIMDSRGKRVSNHKPKDGSHPSFPNDTHQGNFYPGGDEYAYTKGLKFINLIIHDLSGGPGGNEFDIDHEIYGCLIYNNGWDAPNQSRKEHGHGLYVRNNVGIKNMCDNIVFNQFGYNLHAFAGGSGVSSGFDLQRNITFGNHQASQFTFSAISGFMVSSCDSMSATENHLHGGSPSFEGVRDLSFKNNYVTGGIGLTFSDFWKWISDNECVPVPNNTVITGNTFIPYLNPLIIWRSISTHPDCHRIVNNNVYCFNGTENTVGAYVINEKNSNANNDQNISYNYWKTKFGFDTGSNFINKSPTDIIFLYPNAYERGRANIVIYNWTNKKSFNLDASQMAEIGIKKGDTYVIHNAQNFFGNLVVAETTYNGGSIVVPILTNSDPAIPLDGNGGFYKQNMPNTAPLFNVYIIRNKSR